MRYKSQLMIVFLIIICEIPIGLSNYWSQELINLPVIQDSNIDGKGQSICIIDNGIDYSLKDVNESKIIASYNTIYNSETLSDVMQEFHEHGTKVAIIASANGTNRKGIAPNSHLVVVKVTKDYPNDYE